MTVRIVRSHRRDIDDVAACDETEHKEGADEKLCSGRDRRRGGEDDYPPTVIERGSKPRHVPDHVLSLEAKISPRDTDTLGGGGETVDTPSRGRNRRRTVSQLSETG